MKWSRMGMQCLNDLPLDERFEELRSLCYHSECSRRLAYGVDLVLKELVRSNERNESLGLATVGLRQIDMLGYLLTWHYSGRALPTRWAACVEDERTASVALREPQCHKIMRVDHHGRLFFEKIPRPH